MGFEPPGPQERLEAIGAIDALPVTLQRALTPDRDFQPIPVPGPQDWLTAHPEPGQTFDEFRRSQPNRPDALRRVIYLQALSGFLEQPSPSMERLREYAAGFFQLDVKVLAPIATSGSQFTSRTNPATARRQVLTADVLRFLRGRLPADAFCLLAITMEDLYPEPSWDFVFGQAWLRERVGVYSFARHDPAFYGEPPAKDHRTLMLRRSVKVLAHETAHMFGFNHCVYCHCLMNGSRQRA